MPILTPDDLYTNIHADVVAEITRGDNTITEKAIASAISEAKMYLSRYHLLQLFGNESTPATAEDEYLKSIVKSIACWHLVLLSATGSDTASFRTAYTDAVAALKIIMSGQARPEGWPYAGSGPGNEMPDGNAVSWSSNPRRNHFY